MNVRFRPLVAFTLIVAIVALTAGRRNTAAQGSEVTIYLPMSWHAVSRDDLPPVTVLPPVTATATATPTATRTPAPTATATLNIPPTITPFPTNTPEPTEPPVPSLIYGHITSDGDPLPQGYGSPGLPQIELRLCEGFADNACIGDEWEVVRRTQSLPEGRFEYRSPPPLTDGDAYQVWWRNDIDGEYQGTELFLHRWWSRPIEQFGPGDEVDLGVFEVADLKYDDKGICDDCGQTLPIEFTWDARPNRSEVYHWSLFRGCGDPDKRHGAYNTRSLGHVGKYTLEATPRGFRLSEKYCWYILIEDGENGTGWPFHDWRVTFLPQP